MSMGVALGVWALQGHLWFPRGGRPRDGIARRPSKPEKNLDVGARKNRNVSMFRRLRESIHHKGFINCMAVSDDGFLIVTGGDDKLAIMWSCQSEGTELLGALSGHKGPVINIFIKGTFVVTSSTDNTIRKWDIDTKDCVMTYMGHTQRILKVIGNNNFIFSSSQDKTVKALAC